MYNLDELRLDVESSRKTSASTYVKDTQIQGGSLATILQQSLQSEDKDQLSWILSTSDISVIDRTLLQIKDQKTISQLFKQLLQRFQEQSDNASLTLWLRQLLTVHWMTLLKSNPSLLQENISSLQGLKQVIKVKTESLHEMISLRGKIDMLKVTFQKNDPLKQYQKIKDNIKKIKGENQDFIVY